jgi:hypothetical protein
MGRLELNWQPNDIYDEKKEEKIIRIYTAW